ncbi:recombinase RecT [Crossiella sp. CA-258035]|uniref:recombinase RecT n=1 Tax=Crossiella sp. CA-258035 TaxID=2981138 RepID=UPI0024BC3EB1|nr:recombinase RecT [Crossiella sp. CA-258035]WHT22561.1 recombinase RecT [Crossiella sp. CA-258035]
MTETHQDFGDKVAQVAANLPDPAHPAADPQRELTPAELADWLWSKEEQFALASNEIFARHLVQDAINALRTVRNLAKAEPFSLLGAVMTCAQLRLRPVNGRVFILPFWDFTAERHRATIIVGYRGLIDLAFRSGFIRTMTARPVHEGETFDPDYGSGIVVHKPVLRGLPGPVYGYYAAVEYLTGGRYPLYMTREQVEAHRDRHALARDEYNQPIGPWRTDFDAMARKTPLRKLLRDVPADSTTQPLATALDVDGTLRIDASPDVDPVTAAHRLIPAEPQPATEQNTAQEPASDR